MLSILGCKKLFMFEVNMMKNIAQDRHSISHYLISYPREYQVLYQNVSYNQIFIPNFDLHFLYQGLVQTINFKKRNLRRSTNTWWEWQNLMEHVGVGTKESSESRIENVSLVYTWTIWNLFFRWDVRSTVLYVLPTQSRI